MHYEIKFTGSRFEKESQALRESLSYLGEKQRAGIKTAAHDCSSIKEVYQTARFACSMTGIRGYWPVRAIARYMLQEKFPGKFLLK